MRIEGLVQAVFLERLNRFAARVAVDGQEQIAHVPNSGRLRELLVENAQVQVRPRLKPGKTQCTLVMVLHGDHWVMVDAQISNDIAQEAIETGLVPGAPANACLRREVTHGKSRFDIAVCAEGFTGFVEVKCVTLVRENCGYFPDAPTMRGVKHLQELTQWAKAGNPAFVLFMVQHPGAEKMRPNDRTDPAFGQALRAAGEAGVNIHALVCAITPNEARALRTIAVEM